MKFGKVDAKEFLKNGTEFTGGSASVEQHTLLNVEANKKYEVVLSETKPLGNRILNVYGVQPDDTNTIEILKTFNNASSNSFYFDTLNVAFTTSMKISSVEIYPTSSFGTQNTYTKFQSSSTTYNKIKSITKVLI